MPYAKPTWKEKLNKTEGLPKIVEMNSDCAKRWGGKTGDKMVIVRPIEVDEEIRKIPIGKIKTTNEIRDALTKKHKVQATCPLTTGIFLRIAAEAAEDDRKNGIKNITPWWRVVREKNELSDKLPGYSKLQKELLESEGHKVIQKGRKFFVVD